MKRQTRIAISLCAVVLILAAGYCLIFALSRKPYGAIRVGMTPNEVWNLLGKPRTVHEPFVLRRADEHGSTVSASSEADYRWWTEEWNDVLDTVVVTYVKGRVADVTRMDWKEKLSNYRPWPFQH
jgi:hypothetical protein